MSRIQWTDETWNPTTGCDRVSPGCDNCYALALAKRLKGMGQAKYQRDGDPRTSGPGFGLTMHPDVLGIPLSWRKPRMVFVNSMSDVFHEDVSDSFILKFWEVMARTPQHTYQILTKRHGRMRSFSRRLAYAQPTGAQRNGGITGRVPYLFSSPEDNWDNGAVMPLDNVWLGVSVEDQKRAALRIPALVETPAAVRFLSCEPLIAPLDLSVVWTREETLPVSPLSIHYDQDSGLGRHPISWVIVGGESGPGARPCDPEWIRSIVQQCKTAGVLVFVKQLGSVWARENRADSKGGNMAHWPDDLRVREFPAEVTA